MDCRICLPPPASCLWCRRAWRPSGCAASSERHRCRGVHISHDLQLLIASDDAGALAALSDHTADTDGWDDEFLPGYASGASDDGDLF